MRIAFIAIVIVWNLAEVLALPALLAVIGALNGYKADYYIISIGLYFALYGMICLVFYAIGRLFGKRINLFIGSRIKTALRAGKGGGNSH